MKPRNLSFHPGERVHTGMARIVSALVRSAGARVAHPAADRSADIHAVRTTTKRLRALLRLVHADIGELDFLCLNARLRDAARRLCAARENSVARRTLAALAAAVRHPRDRAALAAALAGFPLHAAPAEETETALHFVAEELREVGFALHELRLSEESWRAIGPGLRATYAQGRRRMRAAFSVDDDLAFHRWRIRVKNLYYQLEMLAPACPKALRKMTARLNKLQDKIGVDHDLAMVSAALQRRPDAFGGAESVARVVRLLDKRSARLRRASVELGRAIYQWKPRRFTRDLHEGWVAARKKR